MKVKEIMTPRVAFVQSDDSIKQAALKMEELNVGALPVVVNDEAVGILTDRDIVLRSVAQGLDPEKHKVVDTFSAGLTSCNEEDDIKAAVQLMEDRQIRRVIVKDKEGKMTGILSLGDLAVSVQKEMAGEVLKEVSEPSEPAR